MARNFLEYCTRSGGGLIVFLPWDSYRKNRVLCLGNPFNAKDASTVLASSALKGFFKNTKLDFVDTNPTTKSQILDPVLLAWHAHIYRA